MNKISLLTMKDFQGAVVVSINGGLTAQRRLQNMGIRTGKHITKISGLSGPIVVKIGNSQIAIGRGLAAKIIVKE